MWELGKQNLPAARGKMRDIGAKLQSI